MTNRKNILIIALIFSLVCIENSRAGLIKTVEVAIVKVETETVATTPADRKRVRLGVGEKVTLTLKPTILTPVTWSLTGNGTLSATTGNPITLTAHERASAPSVTATVGGASLPVNFTVVEPTSETAIIGSVDSFPPGVQGAGMQLVITVNPTDVSLANIELLEVPGPATNVTGYFTSYAGSSLNHVPNPNWIQLSSDNKWGDHAAFSYFPAPWSAGGFEWVIPVKWRVVGSTNAASLPNRHQTFSISGASGTSSVLKLGQSVTRTP